MLNLILTSRWPNIFSFRSPSVMQVKLQFFRGPWNGPWKEIMESYLFLPFSFRSPSVMQAKRQFPWRPFVSVSSGSNDFRVPDCFRGSFHDFREQVSVFLFSFRSPSVLQAKHQFPWRPFFPWPPEANSCYGVIFNMSYIYIPLAASACGYIIYIYIYTGNIYIYIEREILYIYTTPGVGGMGAAPKLTRLAQGFLLS